MLLRKLTLKDFRQFKGTQEIIFSQHKDKNVTIIVGENGTGKTTFEQAFTWCLYGETSFSDKSLLCKSTAQEMNPGEERIVSAILEFTHNNTDYKCKTEQTYYRNSKGVIKSKSNLNRVLEYRGKDGQQEQIPPTQIEGEINKILPEQLSNYFFFDGERIGRMSKENAKGKPKDFAAAVKNLLGLSAFEIALYHINGKMNSYSVVKSYNSSYNFSGNSELKNLISAIDCLEKERNDKELRIVEIDEKDLPTIQKEKERIIAEQKKYENVESFVNERKIYEESLQSAENLRKTNVKDFLKLFSERSYNFVALNVINKAVDQLSKADIKDAGIPDIHKRTIDFLINRGCCICGTKIEKDSDIYNHLIEQLKFIPPQSLGTAIRQFVNTANEKVKNAICCDDFETSYSRIRQSDADVEKYSEEISRINKELAGIDENGISKLQKDLEYYSQKEQEYVEERGKCKEAISRLTDEINGKEQAKSKFTNIGETNKKISCYLAYAKYIFEEMQKQYQEEETKVRLQFEETINKIFKEIYNGGLSLKIDEKYNIKILVNDFNGYNEDVETSTAQSLSVILAFISAVIKMARENENSGNKLLVTEAYPLVMDAPLSAFDKTRIQTICEVLPKIAEQVIIFINDKDGEVAEANMKEKIGKKYTFRKENEFETYMEEK